MRWGVGGGAKGRLRLSFMPQMETTINSNEITERNEREKNEKRERKHIARDSHYKAVGIQKRNRKC